MAEEEHVVVYRVLADFTELSTEAAKAQQTVKKLGDTHAAANDKIAASEAKVGKSLDETVKANQRKGKSERDTAKDIEAHRAAVRALAQDFRAYAKDAQKLPALDQARVQAQREQVAKLRQELEYLTRAISTDSYMVESAPASIKRQQQRVRRAPDEVKRTREERVLAQEFERRDSAQERLTGWQQRLEAALARTRTGPESPDSAARWQEMLRAGQSAGRAEAAAVTAAAGRAAADADRAEAAVRQIRTIQARHAEPGMIYKPGSSTESEITRVQRTPGGVQISLADGKALRRKETGRIPVAVPVSPDAAAQEQPTAVGRRRAKPAQTDEPATRSSKWTVPHTKYPQISDDEFDARVAALRKYVEEGEHFRQEVAWSLEAVQHFRNKGEPGFGYFRLIAAEQEAGLRPGADISRAHEGEYLPSPQTGAQAPQPPAAEPPARNIRTVATKNLKPGMIYGPGTNRESEITRVAPGDDGMVIDLASGQSLQRSARGRVKVAVPAEMERPEAAADRPTQQKALTAEQFDLLGVDRQALEVAHDFFSRQRGERKTTNMLARVVEEARNIEPFPDIKANFAETGGQMRAERRAAGQAGAILTRPDMPGSEGVFVERALKMLRDDVFTNVGVASRLRQRAGELEADPNRPATAHPDPAGIYREAAEVLAASVDKAVERASQPAAPQPAARRHEPEPDGLFPGTDVEIVHKVADARPGHGRVDQPELPGAVTDLFEQRHRPIPEGPPPPAVAEAAESVVAQARETLAEELPKAAERQRAATQQNARPQPRVIAAAEEAAHAEETRRRASASPEHYRRLGLVDPDALATAFGHFTENYDEDELRKLYDGMERAERVQAQRAKRKVSLREFFEHQESQFRQAEDATNGYLLNKRGLAAKRDPLSVFTGSQHDIDRYGSDELKGWLEENPRLTLRNYYKGMRNTRPEASQVSPQEAERARRDELERTRSAARSKQAQVGIARHEHAATVARFEQDYGPDPAQWTQSTRHTVERSERRIQRLAEELANTEQALDELLAKAGEAVGEILDPQTSQAANRRAGLDAEKAWPSRIVDESISQLRKMGEGIKAQRAKAEQAARELADATDWRNFNLPTYPQHYDEESGQSLPAHAQTLFARNAVWRQQPIPGELADTQRLGYASEAIIRQRQATDAQAQAGRPLPARVRHAPEPAEQTNLFDYIKALQQATDSVADHISVVDDAFGATRLAGPGRQRARRAATGGDIGDIGDEAVDKAKLVDELTAAEARQEAGSHKLADAMARAVTGLHGQREATARKIPVVGDLVDAEAHETASNRDLADAIREVILAKQRHEKADQRLQEALDTGTTKDVRRAKEYVAAQQRSLDSALKQLRDERALLAAEQRKDEKHWDTQDQAAVGHADEQARRNAKADQDLTVKAKRDATDLAASIRDSLEKTRKLRAQAASEEQKAHTRWLANAKKEADDQLHVEQLELRTAKMRHDHAQQRILDEIKVGAVRTAETRKAATETRTAERHTAQLELIRARTAATRQRGSGSMWRKGGGYRDRTNLGWGKSVIGAVDSVKVLAEGWRSADASGRLFERTVSRIGGALGTYRAQAASAGDGALNFGTSVRTLVDQADRGSSSLARFGQRLLSFRGLIIVAIAALGPLVASLGSLGAGAIGAASAVGGLAASALALPGAFVGAATAIGALVLAFQPLMSVFQAYNAYQDATRVGSLQMADSQRQVSERLIDSQHAVQQASRGLQQAQYAEVRSQVALNETRRQAARDLQDLRAEMDRANLNEESAVLALKRAEDSYRRVLADGNATQLDREEALNRVKQAEFDLRDVRMKNQRLTEDAAVAERRGVAGNLQVVDARNAAENATQAVAEATYQLAKAQRDAAVASREAATGGGQAYTAWVKLQDELNKLGPNTRVFVTGLLGMGSALRKIRENVGEAFFGPLVTQLGNLKSLLDPRGGIGYLLNATAGAMGNVTARAVEMVKSWQDSGELKTIADSNATSVTNLGNAGLHVADAFERLAVLSGPFLEWLTGAVERVATQFDRWTRSADGTRVIGDLLGTAKVRLQEFWDITKNVGSAIWSLFSTSQDFTTWMMEGIKKVTAGWAAWGKEQEKPNSSFRTFLENTKPLLSSIVGFVGEFGKSFAKLAADPRNIQEAQRVFDTLANVILPALVGIFTKLAESEAFSKVVKGLGEFLTAVHAFVENGGTLPLETFITTLLTLLTGLFKALENPIAGRALTTLVTGLAALAAVSLAAKFSGLTFLIKNLDTIKTLAGGAATALAGMAKVVGRGLNWGLNTVTGGRWGRATRAAGGRVSRTGSAVRRGWDRLRGRDPDIAANLRNERRRQRAAQGTRRDRLTDRVTGRKPGTTQQYRQLNRPEARAVAVTDKLEVTNRLLRSIERNTRECCTGSGRSSRQRGTRATGPAGGRPPGTARGGTRPRRGVGAGGGSAPRRTYTRRTPVDRTSQTASQRNRSRAWDFAAGWTREGNNSAVNERLRNKRQAGGAPEQRRQAVLRRAVRHRPDVRTTLDESRAATEATSAADNQSRRRKDKRDRRRERDRAQRQAQAQEIRDLRARRRQANTPPGRVVGAFSALGGRVLGVGRAVRGGAGRATGWLRGVSQGAAARYQAAATVTGGRLSGALGSLRGRIRGTGSRAASRADRLRRRALGGIDQATATILGGTGEALRRGSAGRTRLRNRLRGIGQGAAARYRQIRDRGSDRGAIDFGAFSRRRRDTPATGTGGGINMDRNVPVPGIGYRQDRGYRMLGPEGYKVFQETGEIRAREGGKYAPGGSGKEGVYFARGTASSRYRQRRGDYDYVAEVPGGLVDFEGDQTGAYGTARRTPTRRDATIRRIDNRTGDVDTVHRPSLRDRMRRTPRAGQADTRRRLPRLRRPSIGGTVGVAGLGLAGYAMWDSWFGGGAPQDEPQPMLDENGDPVLDENGQPLTEQPQSAGLLATVGGLGGAAMLGLDVLDLGSGVADMVGGRGGEDDGTSRAGRRAERRAERQDARASHRAAQQERRAAARRAARTSRASRTSRAGRLVGRTAGRLGGTARLVGRTGGRLGGVARLAGRTAGRLGGRLGGVARLAGRAGLGRIAGLGGRLLKGGGPLGIIGAVTGMAADSGLFGGRGSLGKQLGQLGGAALSGAGIGATIGSVIPGVGTAIGGAIGAVGGAGYSLLKDKGLRDRVGDFATKNPIGQILTGPLLKLFNDEFRKQVVAFFSKVGKSIAGVARGAGRWIDEHVVEPVVGFFRSVGKFFNDNVVEPAKSAIVGIFQWLEPFWEIFKGVALFMLDVQAKVAGWIYDNLITPVVNFFVGAGTWIAQQAANIGGWIYGNLIQPVINFFVGAGRWIAGQASAIGGWIYGNLIQPVINFFVGAGRWVADRAAAIGGWVDEHLVQPVSRFFGAIGSFISKLPNRIQHWAHGLPGVGKFIPDAPAGSYASGGLIGGARDGQVDNLNILATAGEFMVRKRAVDQPDGRRLLEDLNNGRIDPSALYAGLNANVSGAMLPVNAPVRAVASSTVVNNTNTRNAGLNIGDVTINNPVRERSDRSMRRTLQTLAYMQDR